MSRRSRRLASQSSPTNTLSSIKTRKMLPRKQTSTNSPIEPEGKFGTPEVKDRALNSTQTHAQECRPEVRQTASAGRPQFRPVHITGNTLRQRQPWAQVKR